MSNKRITDLSELTNPTTDDVFPIVDIATNTTQKVQVGNLPIQTAVTNALATKQATLVSGSNIKTLNNESLLGAGNITLTANPSGVSGAIQFSNGSAFASDASNFFWDDTNKRLGVGTNAPSFPVDVAGEIRSTTQVSAGTTGTNGAFALRRTSDGATIGTFSTIGNEVLITEFSGSGGRLVTGFGTTALKWLGSSSQPRIGVGFNGSILATTHIQGSGSTSATTSLLVQNSAGTAAMTVKDDLSTTFGGAISNTSSATFGIIFSNQGCLAKINSSGNAYTVMETSNTTGAARFYQYVSIGKTTDPVASAALEVVSTTRGFLPPVMTTTQKNAIATPASGLVVYDNTTNKLCCYNGSTWNDLF